MPLWGWQIEHLLKDHNDQVHSIVLVNLTNIDIPVNEHVDLPVWLADITDVTNVTKGYLN